MAREHIETNVREAGQATSSRRGYFARGFRRHVRVCAELYESHRTRNIKPGFYAIERLADGLKVPVEELFKGL